MIKLVKLKFQPNITLTPLFYAGGQRLIGPLETHKSFKFKMGPSHFYLVYDKKNNKEVLNLVI